MLLVFCRPSRFFDLLPPLEVLPVPLVLHVMVLTPLLRDPAVDALLPKLTVAGNWLWLALFPAFTCHFRGKIAIIYRILNNVASLKFPVS